MFRAVAQSRTPGPSVVASSSLNTLTVAPGIDLFQAGHPAPDAGSAAAAERALALARGVGQDGELLVLLSGGASAMLAAPVKGVTLDDKLLTARRLMDAGAPIDELNCVRKHLSRVKGGQLAAAAEGRTVTLALSDVHGPIADDPAVIGSGPTVADPTTFQDAIEVVRRRHVDLPRSVRSYLERGARGEVPETIKPGDPRIARSRYVVIGNRSTAVDGARRAAEAHGYQVITIDEATTGEARDAAQAFVARGRELAARVPGPVCVIGSGETTVTVRGGGRGGRNQEFALAVAESIAEMPMSVALASVGTDGIDGPTDAAGAVVDRTTLPRATHLGLDLRSALASNDAYPFFAALQDLVVWGPTGTNVGDLHVLLTSGTAEMP